MSAPLAGIGLRSPHYQQVLNEQPCVDWLEAHSENFFMKGGPAPGTLRACLESF